MFEFRCFRYDALSQHAYHDFIEAAVRFGFLFMCRTSFYDILRPDTLWT